MLFDVNEDTEGETSIVSMINDILTRAKHLSKDEIGKYITVILNKKEMAFLEEEGFGIPFINEDNRTMIPLRHVFTAFGYNIEWHGNSRTIRLFR